MKKYLIILQKNNLFKNLVLVSLSVICVLHTTYTRNYSLLKSK